MQATLIIFAFLKVLLQLFEKSIDSTKVEITYTKFTNLNFMISEKHKDLIEPIKINYP